jgi:CHAT domain-containing protein
LPRDDALTPALVRTSELSDLPLLRCGLAFAGANVLRADESRSAGVLLGEEVEGLDLRGCDLVVLSACETALGELTSGEGVLGLQRAFHAAGARSVAASLWNVQDAATSVLMEQFYTNLWQKKLSALQALRQAQLFVLKHPDSVAKRAGELRELLVKRGISEEVLALRGIGKKAGMLPVSGTAKQTRSPVAWWAPWVLSGVPGR